jgi:hypothetical protein
MITKVIGTLCIVFICLLIFPIGLGILGGVFGIVMGVFGAIIGLIGGIFGAIFGAIGWIFDGLFDWHWPFHFFHFNVWFVIAIILAVLLANKSKAQRR